MVAMSIVFCVSWDCVNTLYRAFPHFAQYVDMCFFIKLSFLK